MRLFNFSQDDNPTYCTSGRCEECQNGQRAFLHEAMMKIFAEKLALPDDVDEWGRLTYEKEAQERQKKCKSKKRKKSHEVVNVTEGKKGPSSVNEEGGQGNVNRRDHDQKRRGF